MSKISYWEIEELAAAMLGVTEAYENETMEQDIDQMFYDEFDTSMEALHKIVEKLAPMATSNASPLTNTMRRGFVQGHCFIVKVEA